MLGTSALYAQSESSFISSLQVGLLTELEGELELTMRVAVMSAAGFTRPQIGQTLGVEDLDIKMAMKRLKAVADGW